MVSAVFYGAGLLTVLLTPAFAQHAFFWNPGKARHHRRRDEACNGNRSHEAGSD